MNQRESNGGFTRIKRIIVGVSGCAMLIASIILSKNGVGFTGENAWIGLVIAVSLTSAEFMFNSNFEEMNWTTLALGLGAYIYSINTNINGFYLFQNIEGNLWTNFDFKSLAGGIFMDVYPELAIAWSLKESKVGDLVGNIIKSWINPEKMTESTQYQNVKNGNNQNNQSNRKGDYQQRSQNERNNNSNSITQKLPHKDTGRRQDNNPDNKIQKNEDGSFKVTVKEEPHYHPVGYNVRQQQKPETYEGAMKTLAELMEQEERKSRKDN